MGPILGVGGWGTCRVTSGVNGRLRGSRHGVPEIRKIVIYLLQKYIYIYLKIDIGRL